jgi:sigma-E factor negative regulatory protein RseA
MRAHRQEQDMTQDISSLMDGELAHQEAEQAIRSCCASEDSKSSWHLYHVIGDSMRGQAPRRLAPPTEVIAALQTQPTVLAPKRSMQAVTRVALAAAASVATVGVVGWIGSQGGQGATGSLVAKTSSGIQPVANKVIARQGTPVLDVQDYLAAHRQMPSPELYRPVNNRAPAAAIR